MPRSPATARTLMGASGVVNKATGVTATLAADAVPVPFGLVAVAVKVYKVPFVRPDTVTGELAALPVTPPGLAVTV